MSVIIALLALLLFFTILAAPVLVPLIIAKRTKEWPTSVRLAIATTGLAVLHYTLAKYNQALDHEGDFKGFRVFVIPPFQYLYATYYLLLFGSIGLLIDYIRTKSSLTPNAIMAITVLAGCLTLGGMCGQEFMRWPFKEDTLTQQAIIRERGIDQFRIRSQSSSNHPPIEPQP